MSLRDSKNRLNVSIDIRNRRQGWCRKLVCPPAVYYRPFQCGTACVILSKLRGGGVSFGAVFGFCVFKGT